MKFWFTVLACVALVACASSPHAPPPKPPFEDHLFAAPSQRISADDVFALSEEMKSYLRTKIAGPMRRLGYQKGLIDALYAHGDLRLEYDAAMTRNAAQAFAARSGNCLSLVIMTAAFAKELELDVEFRSALDEETWSRAGDLYFRSGHVNVTLGKRFIDRASREDTTRLTIDFLPQQDLRGLRTRAIGEPTVVAMYMNNRAAEALAVAQIDDAYWWAREAVVQDPTFLSAHNTLGVIYLRRGAAEPAARVFSQVLEREPVNTRAMSNLAKALAAMGRAAESAALYDRLAKIEPEPPFHFYELGRAAMERGDYLAARDLFAREVARADYSHESHYWLAVASFKLGDVEAARKHMTLAIENSATRSDQSLYAAKLAWLRSRRSDQGP